MQNQTRMQDIQYAITDTALQTLVFENLKEYQAFVAPHSMLCMTTYEIAAPFPLLVTILRENITLGTDDLSIFHEQFRRIYNIHSGLWLIISRNPQQDDFIRTTLPIGHSVFVRHSNPTDSYETLAEIVSDFVFRANLDRAVDRLGFIVANFRIDTAKCPQCSQRYRIVTGVRLFKNKDLLNDDKSIKQDGVFIPIADFSNPLSRYAERMVNAICRDGKHVCSWCTNSELTTNKTDIAPEEHIKLWLTADDCLRYLRSIS